MMWPAGSLAAHTALLPRSAALRDAAIERRVTPNELVFTAVSHVLENLNAEAA
jgi:hypothetical protein